MLTFDEFRSYLEDALPTGTVIQNPGSGFTTIKAYSARNVRYVRGKSTISIGIADLFSAYTNFRGKQVSSRDLKEYAPHIFDSKSRPAGHSCNCTFLFMVLTRLGIADGIRGDGKAHRPFHTTFL